MYTKLPMGKWGWYAEKLKNEKTLDKKVKVKLAVMLKHICVCVCVEMHKELSSRILKTGNLKTIL